MRPSSARAPGRRDSGTEPPRSPRGEAVEESLPFLFVGGVVLALGLYALLARADLYAGRIPLWTLFTGTGSLLLVGGVLSSLSYEDGEDLAIDPSSIGPDQVLVPRHEWREWQRYRRGAPVGRATEPPGAVWRFAVPDGSMLEALRKPAPLPVARPSATPKVRETVWLEPPAPKAPPAATDGRGKPASGARDYDESVKATEGPPHEFPVPTPAPDGAERSTPARPGASTVKIPGGSGTIRADAPSPTGGAKGVLPPAMARPDPRRNVPEGGTPRPGHPLDGPRPAPTDPMAPSLNLVSRAPEVRPSPDPSRLEPAPHPVPSSGPCVSCGKKVWNSSTTSRCESCELLLCANCTEAGLREDRHGLCPTCAMLLKESEDQ